ncbi:Uncharacterised protein PB.5009, partial [Pycnogonum litorale]
INSDDKMAVKAVKTFTVSGEICHCPAISWSNDNRIALVIDSGIHIFEPIVNIADPSPFFCRRQFIPKGEPKSYFNVGLDKAQLTDNADRDVVTELMLDRTLNPDCSYATKNRGYRTACWCPRTINGTERCILASLSLDHRLLLHSENNGEWVEIADLSDHFYMIAKKNKFEKCGEVSLPDIDPATQAYYIYKMRMYFLSAVDMVWTHCFSDGATDFALLLVAMKSGHLLAWKVKLPFKSVEDLTVDFIQDTGLGTISTITWKQTGNDTGIIVIGSHGGQVQLLHLQSIDGYSVLKNPVMLWDDEDLIPVKCISVGWQSGNYVVVCGKAHYIVSTQITSDGELVRQAVSEGIHSLPLSSICSLNHGWFLASSLDCNIYKFQVDTVGNDITLLEETVVFDVQTNYMQPYGIVQSPNSVFCCLVQRIYGPYDHLLHREPIRVHFFVNQEEDAIWTDLLSCDKRFDHCIDVQEFIRIRLNFENALPPAMINLLESDHEKLSQQSSFVLKLIRYILNQQIKHSKDQDVEMKKSQFSDVSSLILQRYALNLVAKSADIDVNDYCKMQHSTLLSLFLMANWILNNKTSKLL